MKSNCFTRVQKIFGTTLLVCLSLISSQARAADHGDAPGVRLQGNLDINDVYLFTSPTDAANTVMIMTVSPFAGISGPLNFESSGAYEIVVDNNGDAKPDKLFTAKFAKVAADGSQKVTLFSSDGKGKGVKKIASGAVGGTLAVSGGGSFSADDYDDGFFFDLLAFKNSLNFCSGSARNFFNGLNTLALVLEVPTTTLQATGKSSFGIWARTFETQSRVVGRSVIKTNRQFDRMGRPAINTVLVKAANKDKFNKASPVTDRANFEPDALAIMQSLGNSSSGAQTIGDILFPDILTFDPASSGGFPNGRKLTDDVIDTALQLVTGNNAATDCIANDSNFRATFPYMGVKNP